MRRFVIFCLLAVLTLGSAVYAQDVPDVPRERTLFSQGWDFYNQVPSPNNFHPYIGTTLHMRNNLHYTVYEALFYQTYFSGETIGWLGEGWEYNDDFTQLTVTLRDGITWADGEALTADDVVFTIEMLISVAPELTLSDVMAEWVESVEAIDDLNVQITLSKPGPRWATDVLATGQTGRFVVLPQHIWEGEDPVDFANFDLEQGYPVGTGPYTVVKSDESSIFFDLRDSWWAVDAGLVDAMPQVERVVYVAATVEALPQLYINNVLDTGRDLPLGLFEAATAQNPNLRSWNAEGPIYGAANGCAYRLTFNTQQPPFDDVNVRNAINAAFDRQQIVTLAYEGASSTLVAPFALFGAVEEYTSQMQDLFDQYALDAQGQETVDSLMGEAGYTRNDSGVWVDADGNPLQLSIQMQQGNPAGPVIAQQLQNAGFDASFDAVENAAFIENARSGNFETHLWVHCGSAYDPWQTLEHYHSKYSVPEGESLNNVRAYTRYENPELDALLDEMEVMVPSADNAEYMELARQATEIYLRDLPDITFGAEVQNFVFNRTYWTGWPSAEDPYMHPIPAWDGFARVIHSLTATE